MSTKENNLDVSRIENEDWDALAQKVENFYKSDNAQMAQLAKNWERNHLMLDGKQWLVYEGDNKTTGGTWQQLKPSKANEYIPRPTTNFLFDNYQTLKSYLIKNKPRSSVTPNTRTHRDKQAAKIATLCVEANYERLKEVYNYEYAAANLLTYGTVFKKDFFDTSALMMAKVPRMMQMPVTDPMTGMPTGEMKETPVINPETGEPEYDLIPLGDVNTRVVEPYRMRLDPLATDLHTARWIMEVAIQPMDWVIQTYDKDPMTNLGYTGLARELQEETTLPASMQRFYQLKNSSGTRTGGTSLEGNGAAEALPENSVVVKEVYEAPTSKYPKGRLIVVANGKTLYAGDSPCEGPEQGDWHPYSECRWELLPGRFWGKGPVDDGVEIQKAINSIDAVITLTRKTMAIPQKLIPIGCGVSPGQWTGRPGQEIFYRPDPSGVGPSASPPMGVDQQVFAERAQRVEDLKSVTGAIDILKGDRPPGVTAASALNLLYEVGTGKLFPILDRWKAFVESSQKKQLKSMAKGYKEPRPEFIKLLRMKNTELSEEEISHFIGSDLFDNFNVVVEAGSNVPKLQAAKQAALQEAAQTGALNLDLPANRMEFQRQMGISGFDNDIGPDTRRAEWENDLLDNVVNTPHNRPIVLVVDKHDIHKEVLAERMKRPDFISLPTEVQQAYMQHYQEHDQFEAQAAQAQMMQMMAMGGGAMPGMPQGGKAGPQMPAHQPQPGSSAQRPHHSPGAGDGVTKEVSNSLKQDALVPAPIGGK
jgi:hypothetical protein